MMPESIGHVTGRAWVRIETAFELAMPPGRRRVPMLVVFHGQGMTAASFRRICRGIESPRYAVLFVQGLYPFEIRGKGGPHVGWSWYLYTARNEDFLRDARRVMRHVERLVERIAGEHRRIDATRCALFGYSQGGYLAGYIGVRQASRWRGLAVAAARVKDEVLSRELRRGDARELPVLLLHGRADESVPFSFSERSRDALRAAGVAVEHVAHPGGHRLTRALVRRVRRFAERVLASRPTTGPARMRAARPR
ncbi:MAG: prolyl oligopeptidase family serine peptidase [Planctomycetes bacterium]|nr:prolyl oligopeptidase family serine peptidase [Planctomycetota bacterium]